MSSVRTWYIGVYGGEAQARTCSPHPNEVIRDREGDTFVLSRDHMAREAELKEGITKHWQIVCDQRAKIDALQALLTAADELADVLEGLLLQTNELLYAIQGDPGSVPSSAIDAMRGRVFEALKRSKPPTCTWSEGGFSWHTGCGKEWQFTDGGLPAENGMHFCHSCGKTLVVESAESA
ncbi:hypothetical protein C4K03_1259 [Pseudomonas synxantha]|uniref:Uncharacterized protein n=1 Tax=Pseudomonas synxantha TaxID=47883 RepID=A0A3G7U2D2_9PSED|nr:hypothetical protein [Pseudomonas synxantha]AZE53430.1 hypothetical protein C4K03_1259 [Pseudomonas synxantha]